MEGIFYKSFLKRIDEKKSNSPFWLTQISLIFLKQIHFWRKFQKTTHILLAEVPLPMAKPKQPYKLWKLKQNCQFSISGDHSQITPLQMHCFVTFWAECGIFGGPADKVHFKLKIVLGNYFHGLYLIDGGNDWQFQSDEYRTASWKILKTLYTAPAGQFMGAKLFIGRARRDFP